MANEYFASMITNRLRIILDILLMSTVLVQSATDNANNNFRLNAFSRPTFYCNRIPLSYCCIPRVRAFCSQKCSVLECNFRIIREHDGRTFSSAVTPLPGLSSAIRPPVARPTPFLPPPDERRSSTGLEGGNVRRPAPDFIHRPAPAIDVDPHAKSHRLNGDTAKDGTSSGSDTRQTPILRPTAKPAAPPRDDFKLIVDQLTALITGPTRGIPATTVSPTLIPESRTTIRLSTSQERIEQRIAPTNRNRNKNVLDPPQVLGAIDELTTFEEKNIDTKVDYKPTFTLPPPPPLSTSTSTTATATTTTISKAWNPNETNIPSLLTARRDKEWRTVEGLVEHAGGQLIDSDAGRDVIVKIIAMGRRHEITDRPAAIITTTISPDGEQRSIFVTTRPYYEMTPPAPPTASMPATIARLTRLQTKSPPRPQPSLLVTIDSKPSPELIRCGIAPHYQPCVPAELASRNLLRCCQARGMAPGCQALCRYDITQAEVKAAFESHQCGVLNVAPFLECASAGNNNIECCRAKAVHVKGGPQCEVFCNPGKGVGALGLQHVSCGGLVQEMLQCHHAGIRL